MQHKTYNMESLIRFIKLGNTKAEDISTIIKACRKIPTAFNKAPDIIWYAHLSLRSYGSMEDLKYHRRLLLIYLN